MLLEQKAGHAVALLAEGVDRNNEIDEVNRLTLESPSSRRAWIEIWWPRSHFCRRLCVALLAEGVDRN